MLTHFSLFENRTTKLFERFTFQSSLNQKNRRKLNDFLSTQNDAALNKLSSPLWSGCLKYWIAYIRNGQLVVVKCLRVQPKWMELSMAQIGSRNILEIAIPGTHNAASYEIARFMNFPRFDKYIYCQDESIWNQLVYGIR